MQTSATTGGGGLAWSVMCTVWYSNVHKYFYFNTHSVEIPGNQGMPLRLKNSAHGI